MIGHTR